MKHRRKGIVMISLILIVLILAVAFLIFRKGKEDEEEPGSGSPAHYSGVGDTIEEEYGKLEYLGGERNQIELKITNWSESIEEMCILIYGYVILQEFEEGNCEGINFILTDDGAEEGSYIVLDDILKIYIDGIQTDNLFIPADGIEHEVLIDYSEIYSRYENVVIDGLFQISYYGSFMNLEAWLGYPDPESAEVQEVFETEG